MKNLKIKTVIILFSLILSACATASQGTKQKIKVTSTPKNAEVLTSHGYGCDATPCSFNVPRNKSFKLQVAKPGFSTKTVKISPIISNVGAAQTLGSVVLGGIAAGGYDVYNGAALELSPNSIEVELENLSTLLTDEVRMISSLNIFGN